MMRTVYATALAAGLVVLAAPHAFAQPPGGPGGFFRMMQAPGAALLLRDEKVQTELKLTDDQKAAFAKIGDKYKDDFDKARSNMDFRKIGELMKSVNDDVEKAAPDILKADQLKRLKQLEVQAAGLQAFSKDDVVNALKLSDKQKKDIEDQKSDLEKDAQDLFKDAAGDRDKMADAFKKVTAMRKDALDKIVEGMSDDQKKTWKDLTGEKFEFTPFGGRPPRPGGEERKDK
jgi:Spy/CpxP family protein refolding chaperone